MKRASLAIVFLLAATVLSAADGPYIPTDAERARWTLQDMRSWKLALEAYKMDKKSFPAATTLDQARAAIEGVYIRKVPMNDAWGRPYLFERTENGFRLVSAGANGTFDRQSWTTPGNQSSFDADAVITDEGKFWFRSWSMQ